MERIQSKKPLVSIVILNWNGINDTLQCLDSVNNIAYENIETIIVDNGSRDDSIKILKNLKQDFILVENQNNKGFAGGQVSAIPYCSGEYIVLLNNDAIIDSKAITNALSIFENDESIAVVGGRSYPLHDDGSTSMHFYSHQKVDPVTADVHTYGVDDGRPADAINVSGSCAIIRKRSIDEVGYFDERFFAYYEETDLFARFRRAGWRVIYSPEIVIWHKDGASTKDKRYMYYYLMLRNQFLFAYKNFDKGYLRSFQKVYVRNFRRSLWVYLRNRHDKNPIHKARVFSTLWNITHIWGTILDRRKTFSINQDFDYSQYLLTSAPLPITVALNATDIQAKDALRIITEILDSEVRPAEILVITTKKLQLPDHTSLIKLTNIVKKEKIGLTYYDYGFMCSNNDLLIFWDSPSVKLKPLNLSSDITDIYQSFTTNESAAVIKGKFQNDVGLQIVNTAVTLCAIRKSQLLEYLQSHDHVTSIQKNILGDYLAWSVAVNRKISSVPAGNSPLTISDISENNPRIEILYKPLLWHVKRIARKMQVIRVLHKVSSIHRHKETNAEDTKNDHDETLKIDPDAKPLCKNYNDVPIIINTRDRSEPLKKLVDWLEKNGYHNIFFIDNDSTYPPLVAYFDKSPYQLIPLGRNGMHKAPWESFAVKFISRDGCYVVTDPDIIPASDCPSNVLEKFGQLLERYPNVVKVGFGLKIDDLPDHYALKDEVIKWESRFWKNKVKDEVDTYLADIDTTFALYKPKTWWCYGPSLRTGGKLVAKHEPWYQNTLSPTEDAVYYSMRASNNVNTWDKAKLPKHHLLALKKEGLL